MPPRAKPSKRTTTGGYAQFGQAVDARSHGTPHIKLAVRDIHPIMNRSRLAIDITGPPVTEVILSLREAQKLVDALQAGISHHTLNVVESVEDAGVT